MSAKKKGLNVIVRDSKKTAGTVDVLLNIDGAELPLAYGLPYREGVLLSDRLPLALNLARAFGVYSGVYHTAGQEAADKAWIEECALLVSSFPVEFAQ